MSILVTGAAGFIGFHTALSLIKKKNRIIGIDNLNNYYDVNLKKNRIKELKNYKKFQFNTIDLVEKRKLNSFVKKNKINIIIHLAAQAGVRKSFIDRDSYFNSNILGFYNILEISKENNLKHLLFASTSSVYGNNKKLPSKETFNTDEPLSFYAASKKCNEVMAYSYSNMFNLPITCMRFFTVYGPSGRPDMALYKFTKSITKNEKLILHNYGNHKRDFSYISDIIYFIEKLVKKPSTDSIPYNCFNLASGKKETLIKFLSIIENKLKKKGKYIKSNLNKGEVIDTHGDIGKIKNFTKINPKVSIYKGIPEFISWFNKYYKVN